MKKIINNTTNDFFESVAQIIEQARRFVGRTADLTLCVTYFEVGRMIVEEEQGGKIRAEYGSEMLLELSKFLNGRFKKGFSVGNLKNARQFYRVYSDFVQQTLPKKFSNENNQKHRLMSAFDEDNFTSIRQTMSSEFNPFILSWSHYQVLMRIKNEDERRFYELEAAKQQWSVVFLKRQYHSSLYERLALSRNKDEVMRLAIEGQKIEKPRDIMKNPLVLEFLGVDEKSEYSETDLETAIISKLSHFLLEFGKGFLFEARQKRFSFGEQHFFIDLVFYNRLLQCYVLIDLKTTELKHQDLGQMQMYVNYFDRFIKTGKEKPTVGILLCKEKNDSIVELTLPEDSNIYASEYSLYLPDKVLLQQKLAEWIEEFEEEHGWIADEI
ncbi:MAG: PDDEXK nuclease domain-containing protein [Methanimicrococcus sp.]|nr:PDDEXK nuclease domain-containing protein [Methanimicrococcus sp.]